jgi:hypothetical protein
LSDDEYKRAIDIILSPNVESDRAPFFHKKHLKINSIRFHYLCWLAAKTFAPLAPLYKYLFYPDTCGLALVIKETRSTVNMDSMLTGLRADNIIILFRHPCGALASSLRGIRTGKMSNSTEELRRCWFEENRHKTYLSNLGLNVDNLLALPEHKYLAILWGQQNEDYLEFTSPAYTRNFVSYEAFMQDKENRIKRLFDTLSLSYDPMVKDFIQSTSRANDSQPVLKDSSSSFYSVYRDEKFDPAKWKNDLSEEQISDIESLTMDTFNKLLDRSEAGTEA